MKAFVAVALALTVALGMLPSWGYAVETDAAIADHEAMSVSYAEMAVAQDAIMVEHTHMKEGYKDRYFVNEKVTPLDKIRPMEKHCDALIKAAEEEKTRLLEFAKWHQMRAAELRGQ